jgi:hypothetical protein
MKRYTKCASVHAFTRQYNYKKMHSILKYNIFVVVSQILVKLSKINFTKIRCGLDLLQLRNRLIDWLSLFPPGFSFKNWMHSFEFHWGIKGWPKYIFNEALRFMMKMYFDQRFHTPMKLQKNTFNSYNYI